MAIAVPDMETLDGVWTRMQKERPPFERVVVNMVRELAKLNPQSHVHASELYAALNIVVPGTLTEREKRLNARLDSLKITDV